MSQLLTELQKLLEMLGRALRTNGMDDTLTVSVVDEEGEVVDDLGEMKLPETKQ